MPKSYPMPRKTKATVKGQGSKDHDEEEESLTKVTKVLYTRPLPLPFKCPNFVVFNLNGTPSAVRASWRRAILYLRLWCFNNTDQRYQFGNSCSSSCMIPANGKFFIYMHWSGKWLCAVIDGPSLYLDGYITRSVGKDSELKVRENDSLNRKGPVLIEKSKALPWPGSYKRAYECKLGFSGVLPSVKTMYTYVETGEYKSKNEKDKVEMAGQNLILHFPEAARSDDLYEDIDDNFLEGTVLGMGRLKAARRWSQDSDEARSGMHCMELGADTKSWSGKNGDQMPDIKMSRKIIENIRLLYRPYHVHARLSLSNLPVQLGLRGPVGNIWGLQRLIDSHMPSFRFLIKRFSIPGSISSKNLVRENSKTDSGSSSGGNLDKGITWSERDCDFTSCGNLARETAWSERESGFTSGGNLDKETTWSERDSGFTSGGNLAEETACRERESGFNSTRELDIDINSAETDKHTVKKAIAKLCIENTAIKGETEIVQHTHKTPKSTKVHSVGLDNLGQTCYMNSTIQCLHCIPELMDALSSYARNDNGRRNWIDTLSHQLTVAAHDTFSALDTSTTPVSPSKLLEVLREKHPIFAEREHNNSYKHQDAEECWSALVNTFSVTLASEESEPTADDHMKGIFGITLVSRLHRAETGEYLKTQSVELIRCPINDGVKHLHEVLDQSLKRGDSYYEKDSKIHELPRYFTIQLGRMYHHKKLNTMVKIFDKVNHALQLDLYEHCSDEMKLKLQAIREVSESGALGSSSMDIDQGDSIVPKQQFTGIYNLVAIVTHVGPTADRGHYVAWVKQADDTWIQFSDAATSTHEDADILKLSGGSDDEHVPYIYLYKAELT